MDITHLFQHEKLSGRPSTEGGTSAASGTSDDITADVLDVNVEITDASEMSEEETNRAKNLHKRK